MVDLDGLQQAIQGVAATVGGSLVGVGHRWALGSGVVVGPGRVLTNAHNVRSDEVTITCNDGRTATGRPEGVDADADLAVISVETDGTTPIKWAEDGPDLGIGAPVFALANP